MNKKEAKKELKSTEKELKTATALAAVADSEGGKSIVDGFLTDIVSDMETLTDKCTTLPHDELVGLCLDIKHKFNVVKILKNSKPNQKFLATEFKKKLAEVEAMPEDDEE